MTRVQFGDTIGESIIYGNGGWVCYENPEIGSPVFVRFEAFRERFVPVDLFTASKDAITGDLLRKIPLAAIEAEVNSDDILLRRLELPGVDLRRLVSYFSTTFGNPEANWVARSLSAQISGSPEPQAAQQKLVSSGGDRVRLKSATLRDATLKIPARRPYGDAFYQQVAEVHRTIIGRTRSPNALIADANGQNVTTAARWVKEARKRGFLRSSTQGKAG